MREPFLCKHDALCRAEVHQVQEKHRIPQHQMILLIPMFITALSSRRRIRGGVPALPTFPFIPRGGDVQHRPPLHDWREVGPVVGEPDEGERGHGGEEEFADVREGRARG